MWEIQGLYLFLQQCVYGVDNRDPRKIKKNLINFKIVSQFSVFYSIYLAFLCIQLCIKLKLKLAAFEISYREVERMVKINADEYCVQGKLRSAASTNSSFLLISIRGCSSPKFVAGNSYSISYSIDLIIYKQDFPYLL